jgi:RimJ/RimL family protein N-acetyltransferase
VIRATTEADLGAALDLMEAVAREERWIATEAPIDREERAARWREGFDRDDVASFVADADGRIVGSAGISGGGAVPPYLGMFVDEEWRGRGIGGALLEACIEWARSSGAHKVQLEVWPDNVAAISLYEKYGFVREGYLVKHYRRQSGELWDSVVMGLLL